MWPLYEAAHPTQGSWIHKLRNFLGNGYREPESLREMSEAGVYQRALQLKDDRAGTVGRLQEAHHVSQVDMLPA